MKRKTSGNKLASHGLSRKMVRVNHHLSSLYQIYTSNLLIELPLNSNITTKTMMLKQRRNI